MFNTSKHQKTLSAGLLIFLLLGLILSACQAGSPSAQNSDQPGLALEDCQIGAPGLSGRLPARCGTLAVYEDPQAGSGRQIELFVAVIPSVSRSPEPDPLFLLAGGPGQAASETYVQLSSAFQRINQDREIVLVDQRGTGKSNPLTCPLEPALVENSEAAESDMDLTAWAADCLSAIDGSPALYTTSNYAVDLDAARQALGYETINLYGVSYGTRTALTYLKMYPDRVRSVILDGVVPMQEALGSDVARDAQNALDGIFDRCAAEEGCSQAFPQVRQEFADLVASLRASPAPVTLVHPRTAELTEITLSDAELAAAVRLLSYAPETAALLPLLIHTAQSEGKFDLLAAQYLIVSDQLIESIATGLNYSVLCAEDVPFISAAEAKQASEDTYYGSQQTDVLLEICSTWPQGTIPGDYKEAVQSDVPVLLLSGALDPVTPPENAELAAETLPNSLHIVTPGMGHNVIYRGCLPRIADDFIESASAAGLDTACVDEIAPLPFFVNFSGPNLSISAVEVENDSSQ